MTWPESFFFPDTVKVRDYQAGGGMGGGYGNTRTLAAEVIDVQEIVRNAAGEEVISSTRVTVHLEANVMLGSLVTVWSAVMGAEREAEVLRIGRDVNPPPLPSHQILWLK
ncbi:MAG TPA: hypothetical protein VN041_14030 [Microbacterium sp.]|nr:hypothetical protein [Microbacterium sp.]